jgi:hypothetical protein
MLVSAARENNRALKKVGDCVGSDKKSGTAGVVVRIGSSPLV